jgi:glutaredoxin-like protein NrdH
MSDDVIVVYTKPACPACRGTERALLKHELPYRKIDLVDDAEARERVAALGYTQAPVVVAGDQHWSGFRPDRINGLASGNPGLVA